jgi:rhodanese-related sulfurtransferase
MTQLLQFAAHHPVQVAMLVLAAFAVLIYELRLSAGTSGSISPQDAVRLMNQGAAVLDVRSAEAFAAGHIGNARLLPIASLAEDAEALKRFKEKPVIVYCERGNNSAVAIRKLGAAGFTKLFNLRGGLAAWRSENLPVVRGSTGDKASNQ